MFSSFIVQAVTVNIVMKNDGCVEIETLHQILASQVRRNAELWMLY